MLRPKRARPIIFKLNEAQAIPYDLYTDSFLVHVKLQLAQLIANLVAFMGAISSPEYYNLRTNSPLNCKGFPTAWRNIIPYFEHYVSKNGPQKEAEIKSL